MISEKFLKDRIELYCGDCLAILVSLADNGIDSCVTDPPYHLTSIVRRYSNTRSNLEQPSDKNLTAVNAGQYRRLAGGFMGKQWDGGDIAQSVELWQQVYRVLKPGAHLLAFGGTRTYHRMACAIEDAGFEIRDTIMWLYGSGFPKSHDVSKGIDRAAGAEREIVGERTKLQSYGLEANNCYGGGPDKNGIQQITAPATDEARQWQGWGTALKPACEPIVLARKPLSEGTVAANVLKHGVGALNIDGCRVGTTRDVPWGALSNKRGEFLSALAENENSKNPNIGRWPANLIHDGSEEVVEGFPDANHKTGGPSSTSIGGNGIYQGGGPITPVGYGDFGSAARFFYTAKADSDDRLGSKHPTVKPLDLMQYLVRLITPKGGIVLDPFAGTGTTGEAAWREGMKAVLIERESEYQADIRRRIELVLSGPDERTREGIKQRTKDKPRDEGPLFSWS